MAVVMKHFVNSYLDDFYWAAQGGRYYNDAAALQVRQGVKGRREDGLYPEEKLDVPERFRCAVSDHG